ncbi:protein FAR1-RELATED SEQUENCE 5-like [Spinacia oleracea]|uniref:Protein FAR1-RELATED SEQUENCE 5-like n=1 Tax=Spinacia oleracea TaxID=3562 RepID=A0ABM3R3M5_SPIOL|nr:protein FAR1-RELATED SEQUENCE 5-like [Spinacia oleracea]
MDEDKNSSAHHEPVDDVKSVAPSNDEYDDNSGGVDIENLPENFIAPEVWEQIGKALEDFNFDDINKLSFGSMKMCVTFYYMYAKAKGFGARNKAVVRSKVDGKFTSKNLMCSREGVRQLKYLENPNRKRPSRPETRYGCQAVIKFKWNPSDDSWFVRDFVGVHDHELVSPSEVQFIRSHRSLSYADKLRIKALINSWVSPPVTMRNLVQQAGGPDKLPFLKKYLYNACQRIKKEDIPDKGTEVVFVYLFGKQNTDLGFFLKYTRDRDNALDKLFWCDGTSCNDYRAFDNVIAFDTTYKVNAYHKPLVVIVGVNHHRQSVVFVVSLVSHEKEETFKWILEQLTEAGDNVAPYTVLTDGDKAMANAISVVFPKAIHRL